MRAVYQRVIKSACSFFQAGTFIKLLIFRAFCCTKKSLMASCDSGCNAVQLGEAYLYSLSAASAAGHAVAVCPLGGCCVAAGGLKTIGYLSALQSNNLNPALASCYSGCNAVQLRGVQLNEHCSSSFLTRFLSLFHTSCNVFRPVAKSGLASLCNGLSYVITNDKIKHNESKNTDIQGLWE